MECNILLGLGIFFVMIVLIIYIEEIGEAIVNIIRAFKQK